MLLRYLNDNQISLSQANLNYDWFKLIIKKEQDGELLANQAKDVFKIMMEENKNPEETIEEKGYKAQDDGELESIVQEILNENQEAVVDIKE
jgi:aspartyl-tRNA(Asn)/glutamyl-tRNA(Gln) amidotransferase subunit B